MPAVAAPTLHDCDGERDATVLHPAAATQLEARAVWLDPWLLRWPGVETGGRFRLLHSATGRLSAEAGQPATGADGALELQPTTAALPTAVATRFRHVAAGVTLHVAATAEELRRLHRSQMLLVQEDGAGRVLRATRLQTPGALDELYAAAAAAGLGATVASGRTTFALWAPTARNVALCLYRDGDGAGAHAAIAAARRTRPASGRPRSRRDLGGDYYTYLVDVFVPRRRRRAQPRDRPLCDQPDDRFASRLHRDLDAPALKPPGWDRRRRLRARGRPPTW